MAGAGDGFLRNTAPALDPTDVAGAGDVARGAGLRPPAKAVELPPDPTVRAPALDPTGEGPSEKCPRGQLAGGLLYCLPGSEGAGRQ